MNQANCSPSMVHQVFHSLLANAHSGTSHPRMSASASTTTATAAASSTSAAPKLLTSPPPKNSIRYIENDQNNRREKYDGCRWRLVCTWHMEECTNIACTYQLCTRHNALRRNKELPKKKRKPLLTHTSLPILNQNNHIHHHNHNTTTSNNNNMNNDDDDDIVILEDYCKAPNIRHTTNSDIKPEFHDFKMFSVDDLSEADMIRPVKSEPRASSNYHPSTSTDIEYISSKTRTNGLNIDEYLQKNLPPLTEFEEECLGTRLMERFRPTSSMLDAQLYLHNEAIAIVKRNYRVKMDTIAPDYFYDFLLRHPPVALHFSHWFLRCKPIPPTTGCSIDTKVWSLSMIVRGATASDRMNDEYNG